MIDKDREYLDVYGISGIAFEQDGKLYNRLGLEVKESDDGLAAIVIEHAPKGIELKPIRQEPGAPNKNDQIGLTHDQPQLGLKDKVYIEDENSPHYLDEDTVRSELDSRNVSYDKRWGRKKLLAVLEHEIGDVAT